MVCLFKCIIAGAKILIISLIIAFFIIFFHVLAFIVIMSVFHCFEDAFSFLPGGKNLMFLGGGMVSGFMFLVSGVHPLCPSKLGGRAKRRGYVYKRKAESGKLKTQRSPFIVLYIPPPSFALPNVALGSATLRGHRMTLSHSSKDPLCPLTQRDKVGGGAFWFQVSACFLPLRQGEYPQGEGV